MAKLFVFECGPAGGPNTTTQFLFDFSNFLSDVVLRNQEELMLPQPVGPPAGSGPPAPPSVILLTEQRSVGTVDQSQQKG